MHHLRVLVSAAALSIAALGHATAQTLPDYYPADYGQIVEGSRGEEPVLVFGNVGEPGWAPVLESFREKFPWIEVQILNLSGNEVFERYNAEDSAGISSADVLLGFGPVLWTDLLDRGKILPYQSAESGNVPDWSIQAEGVYTYSTDPWVLAWNKVILPENEWPKSLADMAALVAKDPGRFEGKLGAMPPWGNAGAQSLALHQARQMGEESMLASYGVLGPKTQLFASGIPVCEKIISGEFTMGYYLSAAGVFRIAGDPVQARILGWTYPSDGTPVTVRNIAIASNSNSPNSAKLLIDHVLSAAGQRGVAMGGLVPYRPGVDVTGTPLGVSYDSMVEAVGEENLVITTFDPDKFADPDFAAKMAPLFKYEG